MCECLWKPEEGVKSPAAGVTGSCEPLGVGAASWKSNKYSNHQAVLLASAQGLIWKLEFKT